MHKLMSLGEVQRVLQQLLREQVSIRDLGAMLEVLVEAAAANKNVVHLVESVRQTLGRGLVHPLLDGDGGLKVVLLEGELESQLVGTFDPGSQLASQALLGEPGARAGGQGETLRRLLDSVKRLTGGGQTMALPVLLCPSPARYHVRRWLEPFVPKITVLAPIEIPPEIRVRSVGTIG